MILVSEFHINQSLDLISDSSWPDSHSENPINNLDLLGKIVETEVIPFAPYDSNFSRILT